LIEFYLGKIAATTTYVSLTGDFCSKLRVLNLKKIEKKCIKMGRINQNSEKN